MTTEKFKTTLVRNSFCIRLECSSSTCSSRGASLKPRRAPSRLPIVFAQTIDPIGNGFIERMSRPGGNITGFTQFEYVLSAKWQELLKEVAPAVTRAGVIRELAGGPAGNWAMGGDRSSCLFTQRRTEPHQTQCQRHELDATPSARPAFFRLNEDLLPTVRSRTQKIPKLKEFRGPVRIIFGDADPSLNSGVSFGSRASVTVRRLFGNARSAERCAGTCTCFAVKSGAAFVSTSATRSSVLATRRRFVQRRYAVGSAPPSACRAHCHRGRGTFVVITGRGP